MTAVALAWTAHPARRCPEQLALVAAVVLLTTWVVLVTLGSILLAVLAAALLVASTAAFLFPTRYRLDDDGIEERRLGTRKFRTWADLRRLQVGPGAALVSPFARPSWLDRHRGFVLYFDGLDAPGRARVIELLRARVSPPGATEVAGVVEPAAGGAAGGEP